MQPLPSSLRPAARSLLSGLARTSSHRRPQLFLRAYASGLSSAEIEKRVFEVMSSYSKVNGKKITLEADFSKDLGLDSLDAVEVVMAVEDEFSIEIPDKNADEITTVKQIVDYITTRTDAT